jgi:hypothetical protein
MTKEEFITYVRAIIDMEIETAKRVSPQYELIGALKLIEEALSKVDELTPSPSYPIPTLPYTPINPIPPYYPYTINCTTSTSNTNKK